MTMRGVFTKKTARHIRYVLMYILLNIVFIQNVCSYNNNSFLITNKNNTDKTIKLNGKVGFFNDMDELKTFINTTYSSDIYLYDYQKAWRFMVDYTWVAKYPLTYAEWYHNPLVFINSTGWGFCDDKSIVLSKIWASMGYKTRVCYMNGHVVPEVFIKNRWEMWDPTFQVFYKDSKNTILGVEDLIKDNSAALKPHYDIRIKSSVWLNYNGYSKEFALLYKSPENFRFKNTEYIPVDKKNMFLLPQNARIIFPIYKHFPLKTTTYELKTDNQNRYAQLMLQIPPLWTGKIFYPIVLHAIVSSGAKVIVGNERILLNYKCKTFVVEDFTKRNYIEIIENEAGIKIFYLINPKLFESEDNFENIKAYLNSENIELEIIKLPLHKRPNILSYDEISTNNLKSYLSVTAYFLRRLFF